MKTQLLLILSSNLFMTYLCCGADTVINFDDLPDGTWITSQYHQRGLDFTQIPPGYLGAGGGSALLRADPSAPSGPNVVDIQGGGPGEYVRGLCRGEFTEAHHHFVQVTVGALSGHTSAGGQVTLTAYDLQHNVVGTEQVTVGSTKLFPNWLALAVVSRGEDIASFELDAGNNRWIGLDDLTFDTLTGCCKPDFSLTLVPPSAEIVVVPQGTAQNWSSSASVNVRVDRLSGSTRS